MSGFSSTSHDTNFTQCQSNTDFYQESRCPHEYMLLSPRFAEESHSFFHPRISCVWFSKTGKFASIPSKKLLCSHFSCVLYIFYAFREFFFSKGMYLCPEHFPFLIKARIHTAIIIQISQDTLYPTVTIQRYSEGPIMNVPHIRILHDQWAVFIAPVWPH